jgi:hypothetical protein
LERNHADEIAEASHVRDTVLRERGTKITLSTNVVVTSSVQTDSTTHTERHWLLSELSEFQRQVLAAFTDYCQESGQSLLVEDPEVLSRFCDDAMVTERLQAFGQSHGNRIRRLLSQLASLGLIAKITLPKQDPKAAMWITLKPSALCAKKSSHAWPMCRLCVKRCRQVLTSSTTFLKSNWTMRTLHTLEQVECSRLLLLKMKTDKTSRTWWI